MCWPRGGCDKVAIDAGGIEWYLRIATPGELNFGAAGGVAGAGAVGKDSCSGEQLDAMADGGDGFTCLVKVPYKLQDAGIQPQVFRCPSTWNEESVVVCGVSRIKIGVQGEIMPGLFAVCLITFEVMHGRPHTVSGLFARANGIDLYTDGLQRLEGDHDFVIFNEIAGEQEDAWNGHLETLYSGGAGA